MEELAIVLVAWLLWPRKKADDTQTQILLVGDFPVPDDDDVEPTLHEIWRGHVSDVPRPGFGYQGGQGENLFGTIADNGIIARALAHPDGLGRPPTGNESARYYAAIGRVRSNARLYGTRTNDGTPNIERYNILTAAGATESQTITAARCPWHESWWDATQEGRLPSRRIGFNRTGNKCSGLKRVGEWGTGSRYGVLWLPPVSVLDMQGPAALAITGRADLDWPAEVFEAAGTTWDDFTGLPTIGGPGGGK